MSCTHDCGCTPETRDARTDEWVQIAPVASRPAPLSDEHGAEAPGRRVEHAMSAPHGTMAPQHKSGPGSAPTLWFRGLTAGKERLMPKRTRASECVPFTGREKRYQAEAAEVYYVETGLIPSSWVWITTTCGTDCLNHEHMRFNQPVKLAYPDYVCIYCGRSGYTKDHLFPRRWSGDTRRAYVVTVPACGTCNNVLGDVLTWSITERRAICHYRLRRRYRSVLRTIEFGESDLDEMGPNLRTFVEESIEKKRAVDQMLSFPDDAAYDLRACQKSGIEDPFEVGLIISPAEALRIAREVA